MGRLTRGQIKGIRDTLRDPIQRATAEMDKGGATISLTNYALGIMPDLLDMAEMLMAVEWMQELKHKSLGCDDCPFHGKCHILPRKPCRWFFDNQDEWLKAYRAATT